MLLLTDDIVEAVVARLVVVPSRVADGPDVKVDTDAEARAKSDYKSGLSIFSYSAFSQLSGITSILGSLTKGGSEEQQSELRAEAALAELLDTALSRDESRQRDDWDGQECQCRQIRARE